jgi:uncharacterized ferritin-like protein (DUF455 family)
MTTNAPPDGTVEAWAWSYVHSTSLAHKLAPPKRPLAWERTPEARRVKAPGRPPELSAIPRAGVSGSKSASALRDSAKRAAMLHTFLHHELQAAELMAWAFLAFPDAPTPFRRGLLGIFDDEVRHMRMYGEHMATLGLAFGDRPVNDWFWERVPLSASASHFAATMGMGFEGGNLDHATRFADRFREAGDVVGASLQARVAEEEIPHVAFATHWFRALTKDVDFDVWRAHLPEPLTPMIMRGQPMNHDARLRAGYPTPFLARLAAW